MQTHRRLGLQRAVYGGKRVGSYVGKSMPDTRWLEQRRQGWYAVQDVPRPLRPMIGKNRLIVSLQTRDLKVAQARRHDALAQFARQIAAARRPKLGDPVAELGMHWRASLAEDDGYETRQAAAFEYHRIEHERGLAAAQAFADISLGKATPLLYHIDSWLAEGGAKGPLRPKTQGQYRSDIERLGDWLGAIQLPTTIEAVTPAISSRYVTQELIGKGVDWATGNRKISAGSSYWRWMIKRAGLITNPWAGQSLSKPARSRVAARSKRSFTDAEVSTLLAGPADAELADAMRVAALTGARLEELYQLRVRDCSDEWFDIQESKTRAGVRRVPIHSSLAGVVARRTAGKAPTAFLFDEPEALERHGRSSAISKRFGRYRQRVGVHEQDEGRRHSKVDFHSWRRWFVTKARNAGIDRAVVAAVVGHETRNITDGVYSSGPSAELLRTCIEAVRLP